ADGLAGQINFKSKGENRNFGLPKRDSLNWCYGIKICGNTAVIADSGNNRILLWQFNYGTSKKINYLNKRTQRHKRTQRNEEKRVFSSVFWVFFIGSSLCRIEKLEFGVAFKE
ncbi:hypothetical protein FM036_41040, partial [Nostoc sp. HG1]|nr:hypothetical protein [Nostoc sp. HG1]